VAEKVWCLKHCDIFASLQPDQLLQLENRSRMRAFSAGSPVYLPSSNTENVFLLARGMVKVCNHTPEGKSSIIAFIEPGEMFGEVALFSDESRDEFVEAIELSTVVMIPTAEVQRLMSEKASVAIALTKMVGLRRRRIERRLKNLLFLSSRDRLIHLLLDLAEQFGSWGDDGIRLRIRLAHQEIANLMGSTRETVTILLGQLKAEGFIDVGRRKIVLINAKRLSQSVQRAMPSQPT